MRMKEIEARLAAIKKEIESRGAVMNADELDALEQETKNLTEERAGIVAAVEKRNGILKNIASGTGATVRSFEQEPQEQRDMDDPYATPEYRTAWLKQVRGLPLNEVEKRAYANAATTGAEVIPTSTANKIVEKVKTLAPMLEEIELLHVKGAVRFAVEGATNEADIHAENATISDKADTLAEVALSGYEITKLLKISSTVMTMSIPAFEGWIVNMLAKAIARKIEKLIINGTGTDQPKGIEKANSWDDTNSVTVTASASLTAANVRELIALLPAGYDSNGKFVMSKKTLFTDFMPLQDNSKNKIVTNEGRNYFVYGYPVLLSDYVTNHEAFLGDFSTVCGNLAEDITVRNAYDIDTNSQKYIGVALFDCKPALGKAIMKLIKATE